jgi:hypothetical protein
MRSRRLYNYRVFLECSEYRLLLSIFSKCALESLVNIFLAETMHFRELIARFSAHALDQLDIELFGRQL